MEEKKLTESKMRSAVKLITFKITEVIISAILFWLVTGSYVLTIGMPLLIEGIQGIAIFIVERGWTRIEWGKECKNCHYFCFHEKRKNQGKGHD